MASKTICMECKRVRKDTVDSQEKGSNHTICAKCLCCGDYRSEPLQIERSIKQEVEDGVEWVGAEKDYADQAAVKLYDELRTQCESEKREREGGLSERGELK